MQNYIKSISALNELALKSAPDELRRFSESDIFWAKNKSRCGGQKVKKGEILQFEFGKNYSPEMSYEHRGLVIGISGALLYVLPICSYSDRYKGAYHPVDNPDEHSGYYMMKTSDFPFLPHDSVLKLNDIRTVSTARIKYRQPGARIPPESDTYRNIESLVHAKYFFDHSFELKKLRAENESLKQEIARLSDKLESLTNQ